METSYSADRWNALVTVKTFHGMAPGVLALDTCIMVLVELKDCTLHFSHYSLIENSLTHRNYVVWSCRYITIILSSSNFYCRVFWFVFFNIRENCDICGQNINNGRFKFATIEMTQDVELCETLKWQHDGNLWPNTKLINQTRGKVTNM